MFGKTGLNNWSKSKSPKGGTEPGVRKGKRSLLVCQTRCKCSIETSHKSLKAKIGIKVMQLVECLNGLELTMTVQGSKCHSRFVRGSLHIAE